MKRLLISGAFVAVLVVAAVVLAGCGGGSGNSASAPASGTGTATATVSSDTIAGSGNVLVDSQGEALYANDQEKNGMALCDGACLSFWTPLTASGTPRGDSLSGKLGVADRPDGTKQVTYNGKLLYTFYLDKPGKVAGDGFDDAFGGKTFTWHVVHATGATTQSGGGTGTGGGSGFPGY
jgi:predicted lipoprotein with Yx(FWY)xxD motif